MQQNFFSGFSEFLGTIIMGTIVGFIVVEILVHL